MKIDTSLLREKFIIKDKNASADGKSLDIICRSTRMQLDLPINELEPDTYIIRSFNMQSTSRMAAQMIEEHTSLGPLTSRSKPLDWSKLWKKSVSKFEQLHAYDKWICIYNKGQIIFSSGYHHQFFDVVEKCDSINKGEYENSIKIAEDYFRKAGKEINLEYKMNVALIANISRKGGKCSLLLRGTDKITTFNYKIQPLEHNKNLNITEVLGITADFFEGLQLTFIITSNSDNIINGVTEKYSEDDDKAQYAKKHVKNLDANINRAENTHKITYRPERPDFVGMIDFTQH